MERDERKRPRGAESAAEHPAPVIHAVDHVLRSREDRTRRGVEVLVERHVDGVERPRRFGRALAGVRGLQEESRAIEVQPDALAARERDDLLHLDWIEALALLAAHGRFNRNRRHAGHDARAFRLVEDALDVVGAKRRSTSPRAASASDC